MYLATVGVTMLLCFNEELFSVRYKRKLFKFCCSCRDVDGSDTPRRVCAFGPTVSNDGGNGAANSMRNMTNAELQSELCCLPVYRTHTQTHTHTHTPIL